MLLLCLFLGGLTFVFGSGVALFPVAYGGFLLTIFICANVLERRYPSYRLSLLLATSSALLAVILSEIALRVAWDDRLYHRPHDKYFERSPEFEGRYRYRPNVDVTRESFGDLAAFSGRATDRVYRRERFVTDERGFRNHRAGPDDPIDVVLLGDSFGAGIGTSQELTWPALLAEELGVNLYNLSLPGSPADELYVLVTELPRLRLAPEATLVWLLFTGNDLADSFGALDTLSRGGYELTGLRSFGTALTNFQGRSAISRLIAAARHDPLYHLVERRTIPRFGDMLFYAPHIEASALTSSQVERLPGYEKLSRVMQETGKLACAEGLRLLIAIAPSKEEIYLGKREPGSGGIVGALEAQCRALSLDCLDLAPALLSASESDLLWWPDDTHWNARGNEVVARSVAAWIEGLGARRSVRSEGGCAFERPS